MISLENLRPNPESDSNELPFASDGDVQMVIASNIDGMMRRVDNRFRFSSFESKSLFEIHGGIHDSHIDSRKGNLRVERKRLQELSIEIMIIHGLNPENPQGVRKEQFEQTTIEHTIFRSSVPDMAFVRHHKFITETRDPVYVAWTVMDVGPENWWERVKRK